MPLLKLWNSLRGRTQQQSDRQESTPELREQSGATAAAAPTVAAAPETSLRIASGGDLATADKVSRASAKKRGGGLFRSNPHAALCKQLKSLQVSSVLEISVDDGSRAVAVMEALSKSVAGPVRYAAIDAFEMGDGTSQLKAFFQTVRNGGFSPKLFPDSIEGGLRRVADTLGAIDLILIAAPKASWQQPETLRRLSRITHEKTVILFEDEQGWHEYQQASSAQRRAA